MCPLWISFLRRMTILFPLAISRMSNRLLSLRSLFRSLSLDSLATARLTLWSKLVPNSSENSSVATSQLRLMRMICSEGSGCRMVTLFGMTAQWWRLSNGGLFFFLTKWISLAIRFSASSPFLRAKVFTLRR